MVKNLPANAGDVRDVVLIPRSGRSPGGLSFHLKKQKKKSADVKKKGNNKDQKGNQQKRKQKLLI